MKAVERTSQTFLLTPLAGNCALALTGRVAACQVITRRKTHKPGKQIPSSQKSTKRNSVAVAGGNGNFLAAVFSVIFVCGSSVIAGTVITTNLPAGSAIINIHATADGAAAFTGPNADAWYSPFNVSSNLLEFTFQPGAYTLRVIDQNDAATMFASLTPAQLSEIGGAWTYNTPWATDYLAFDLSAATDPSQHQLFTGAVTDNGFGYGSPGAAYQEAINVGYYNQIVTGSGRYTGTTASSYTFSSAETLIFTVPDNVLSDNTGIVSVLVTPVPEPSSLALLGIGMSFLGMFGYRQRSRRA